MAEFFDEGDQISGEKILVEAGAYTEHREGKRDSVELSKDVTATVLKPLKQAPWGHGSSSYDKIVCRRATGSAEKVVAKEERRASSPSNPSVNPRKAHPPPKGARAYYYRVRAEARRTRSTTGFIASSQVCKDRVRRVSFYVRPRSADGRSTPRGSHCGMALSSCFELQPRLFMWFLFARSGVDSGSE